VAAAEELRVAAVGLDLLAPLVTPARVERAVEVAIAALSRDGGP